MAAKKPVSKKKDQHRQKAMSFRAPDEHWALYERAAEQSGLDLTNWMRSRLFMVARQELGIKKG